MILMLDDRKKLAIWLTGFASVALLAVHAYLGWYSRFVADDFCRAAVASSKGVLGGTVHSYMNGSGRFSANFLDSLAGSLPGLTPYAPAFALAIWLLLVTGLLHVLMGESSRGSPVLPQSAILVAATLIVTPDVLRSLYWGEGMRSVVPPLILGTAFAGLLFHGRMRPTSKIAARLVAAGTLAFVAGGFSEAWVALQTFLLAGFWIIAILLERSEQRRDTVRVLGTGVACSTLAMLVMVVAPGNGFWPSSGVSGVFATAVTSLGAYLGLLVDSPISRVGLLGLAGIALLLGRWNAFGVPQEVVSGRVLKWTTGVPLFTLGALTACFVPAAWQLSAEPRLWVYLIPTWIVILAISLWAYVLGLASRSKASPFQSGWTRSVLLGTSCFMAVMFVVNDVGSVFRLLRLRPELRGFAESWDAVDDRIRGAGRKGERSVVVPRGRNVFGLENSGTDGDQRRNECLSAYYGLAVTTALPEPWGADVDGDGKADLLWRNAATGETKAWTMDGARVSGIVDLPDAGPEWTQLAVADLDGSGTPDIVWRRSSGEVRAWLMDGTAVTAEVEFPAAGPEWTLAAVGDLDGQGKQSLIWAHTTGQLHVWRLDDGNVKTEAMHPASSPEWRIVSSGDFDGDGKDDLVLRVGAAGALHLWFMDGVAVRKRSLLPSVNTGRSLVAVADFDANGKVDLVWRDGPEGDLYVWRMNRGLVTGRARLSGLTPDWSLAQTGDFDRNGTPDLVWRNPASGELEMWLMNGASIRERVVLPRISSEWTSAREGGS